MSDDDDEAGGKPRARFGLWRSPEKKLEQASTDTGKEEEELLEKLNLQMHGENGNDVPAAYGTIDFVIDRDNDAPARFIVVSSRAEPQSICKVMTDVWHLARPSVILSVTGGAAPSLGLNAQLEEAYVKGLANAAQSTRSWIISGGSDAGVMQLTGKVMSWLGAGTPCIGIASYDVIMYKEKFVKAPDSELTRTGTGLSPRSRARYAKKKKKSREVKYWKQDKPGKGQTAIDPNHTHFVLVDNVDQKGFGGEVEMRAHIEEYMAREAGGSRGEVPLVCLCVGGGPGTFDTLLEQLRLQSMVLLLSESGGAAGAITKFIEAYCEGFPENDATDQQLIELVDKLADDELISELERVTIKRLRERQARPDKTGKVKTVAHVLVEAVTATPKRIHFHKQEDGPFDEVKPRFRVSRVLPFLVLSLSLTFAWRPPTLTLTLTRTLTLTLAFTFPLSGDPARGHLVVYLPISPYYISRRSCTWSSRRTTA